MLSWEREENGRCVGRQAGALGGGAPRAQSHSVKADPARGRTRGSPGRLLPRREGQHRAPGPSAHLEELDPDAGEHELQEGGDEDDVPDGADGHEHTLHHVLRRERRGLDRGSALATRAAAPRQPGRDSESGPVVPPPPPHPLPPRPLTFSPLALLMARRGRSTLSTLRIFTTEMELDLGAAEGGQRAASSLHLPPASPSGLPLRTGASFCLKLLPPRPRAAHGRAPGSGCVRPEGATLPWGASALSGLLCRRTGSTPTQPGAAGGLLPSAVPPRLQHMALPA